jgi:hypothetical protein
VDFFFVFLAAAEFYAGAAFGLCAIKAGAFKIVGAMLNVRAKFFFQLGVHLRTLKESGDSEANRIENFHASSGYKERDGAPSIKLTPRGAASLD